MFNRRPSPRLRDTALLSGWLFADLLLALAIIFLANNTSFALSVSPTPTPVATLPPTPTPMPTQPPSLNKQLFSFNISVDTAALLNNDPQTIADFQQKVLSLPALQHHRVGFVIAYGVAEDNSAFQLQNADNISQKVIDILSSIKEPIFSDAAYYHKVLDINPTLGSNIVELDIFVFN